jgi:hypothetical protein
VDEFEDLFLADEEMREWDEEDGIPELGWVIYISVDMSF